MSGARIAKAAIPGGRSGSSVATALSALGIAALILVLAAPRSAAESGFELPFEANTSVAVTDEATGFLVNPAAGGLRYGGELIFGYQETRDHRNLYRGVASWPGFALDAAYPDRGHASYGASVAGGDRGLRLGATWSSLASSAVAAASGVAQSQAPNDREDDVRLGALSRPNPWLSLGGAVDHLFQPRLAGRLLERTYTVGLGLRPLALSPTRAYTLGTRLTLSVDARLVEGAAAEDARFRFGGALELAPGVAITGSIEDRGGPVRLGISILSPHAGLHGQMSDPGKDETHGGAVFSAHHAEDRTVVLASKRIAYVPVGGSLGDDALTGVTLFGAMSEAPVAPLRRQLDRALEDPRTRGVLLSISGVSGMAAIEELRPRVDRLRRAGKPVVAYLEFGGKRPDLYLASACNAIVTSPQAFWAGLGLHVERRYYRKFLEDWGVRLDRTSYGKYKSAYRNYSVDSTSDADREALEHLIDDSQARFVSTVAGDRKIPEARLLTVLDGRAWTSAELAKLGVVDTVGYYEDALRLLGRLAGLVGSPAQVRLAKVSEAHIAWRVPQPIAIVYASGAISTGKSGSDLLLGPYMGSETMARQLERAFKNPEVRAVVFRVDSPGGSSLGSDLIAHAATRFRRATRKPLIVSMGAYAASGGYHISLPADRIYADRWTRTGSIGVLTVRPSFEGFYRKHDVRQDDFGRGDYMRAWSSGHDWNPREQASADSAVYAEYRDFVDTVARARGLSWAGVDSIAQGRVWTGEDAVANHLADEIGGLDAAVAEARRRARVPEGERIEPVEYRRPAPGLISSLVGSWVRSEWDRSVRMPAPGETLLWMDDARLLDE